MATWFSINKSMLHYLSFDRNSIFFCDDFFNIAVPHLLICWKMDQKCCILDSWSLFLSGRRWGFVRDLLVISIICLWFWMSWYPDTSFYSNIRLLCYSRHHYMSKMPSYSILISQNMVKWKTLIILLKLSVLQRNLAFSGNQVDASWCSTPTQTPPKCIIMFL